MVSTAERRHDGAVTRESVDAVFSRLAERTGRDPGSVARVFRRLMRETHPDRVGDDGSLFLYVRERCERYRIEEASRRMQEQITRGAASRVDPTVLLRDLGVSVELSPRAALLAALYRFRALGLANWRVRSRPTLRRRNAAVLQTIVAWAYRYDPRFVPIFHDFLLHQGNFTLGERHASVYFAARRLVLRGLDGLIRYQDHQRPATAEIARDRLLYALQLSRPYRKDPVFAPLRSLAGWLLEELRRTPDAIGLDG